MLLNEKDLQIVNSTARYKGPTVVNAVVPIFVEKYAKDDDAILDYGAGYEAIHTMYLRSKGLYVTAYDVGNNVNPDIHKKDALKFIYDVIFASNVLNVLPSDKLVEDCIVEIAATLDYSGLFICNFPNSPRKSNLTFKEVQSLLLSYFDDVEIEKNHKGSSVFICRNPVV